MIFSFRMRCLGVKEPLGKLMNFPGELLLCMSSRKCEEAPIILSLRGSRVSHWVMCNSQISSVHPVSISSCTFAGSCGQEDVIILYEPPVYMFYCSANTLTQKATNNLELQVARLCCSGIWRIHTEGIEPLTVFLWLQRLSIRSTAASQHLVKSINWKLLRLGPVTPQQHY